MRRFAGDLLVVIATVAAFVLGGTPTAAHAARTITAIVPSGVGCPAGQIMIGAKFTLSRVNSGQKITVETQQSTLVRVPTSYSGGTAFYDVLFDAKVEDPTHPASTIVPDNWDGQFVLSAAMCRAHTGVRLTVQTTTCGMAAQISVLLNNTNTIMVTYVVSGNNSLTTQTRQVLAGRTEEVLFDNVTRGRTYSITATGDDGTSSSRLVTVAACTPAPAPTTMRPPSPTTPATVNTVQPPRPDPTLRSASPTASASATPSATPEAAPTADSFGIAGDETPDAEAIEPQDTVEETEDFSLLNSWLGWGGTGLLIGGALLIVWLRSRRHHTP